MPAPRSVRDPEKGGPEEPEVSTREEEGDVEEEEDEAENVAEEEAGAQREPRDVFPEILDDADLWKIIYSGEGDDEGEDYDYPAPLRPRLTSVVSPSLSATPESIELSSITWSPESPSESTPSSAYPRPQSTPGLFFLGLPGPGGYRSTPPEHTTAPV